MSTYLVVLENYLKTTLTKIRKIEKKNYFFILAGIELITLLIFLFLLSQPNRSSKNNTSVTIEGNVITAEIADDDKERAQGLSVRSSLPKNQGMLFVFEVAKKYPFWMKDMKFPIDIIWINQGKIVDITNNAKPETTKKSSLTIYRPDEPAQYVLEVNANYTLENDIEVGDKVEVVGFN